MSDRRATETLSQVRLLSEPVRRALYDHVRTQPDPVDRDAAAAAVGIGRPLAAFHLDRLAEAGLLEVEYHRRSGRTGPGAGRPAKFYRRAPDLSIDLSLPPRRYALAGEILADAVSRVGDVPTTAAILAVARERGRQLVSESPASSSTASSSPSAARGVLVAVIEATGYEPEDGPAGIRLRNCPFDALASRQRDLTCGMNLALLGGVADGLPAVGLAAEREIEPGYCCVAFRPRRPADPSPAAG
ncbi:MAG: transcriptional regulator [Chloroflexota bacterium]|nr:transcriptional regulator [Chloroflexota bacterium]